MAQTKSRQTRSAVATGRWWLNASAISLQVTTTLTETLAKSGRARSTVSHQRPMKRTTHPRDRQSQCGSSQWEPSTGRSPPPPACSEARPKMVQKRSRVAVGKGRNSYNYGASTTSKKQSTAMPSWTDWAEAKPVDEEFGQDTTTQVELQESLSFTTSRGKRAACILTLSTSSKVNKDEEIRRWSC